MHMPDFYFEQLVTEAFLDQVFDWAEQADLEIRQDVLNPRTVSGTARGAIHKGGEITPTAAPSLSVKATAMVASDPNGRRVYWADEQTIDCTLDFLGVSTSVSISGEERYLGVFAEFDRELTEERIDGNGVPVFTQKLESSAIKVVSGAQSSYGTALPPATPSGKIRLANIKLVYNQTQILTPDIEYDTENYMRDDWVRVPGSVLGDFVHGNPSDAIEELFGWMDIVSGGGSAFTPTGAWHDDSVITSITTSSAINEIVSDLAGSSGSDRIGGSAHTTSGGRCNLPEGSVQDQLRTIADTTDSHIGGGSPQHTDEAITAGAKSDSPSSLSSGTVNSQLIALLAHINDRVTKTEAETISGLWTHTVSVLFNSLVRLADYQDSYIEGNGSTATKWYTIFKRSGTGVIGRLLYSGDADGAIMWTYNAYWNHTTDLWYPDDVDQNSLAIRLNADGLFIHKMDKDDASHDPGWFDEVWTTTYALGRDSVGAGGPGFNGVTAFFQMLHGPEADFGSCETYDRVRASLSAFNSSAGAMQFNNATSVTWHAELSGIVSGDITLTVERQSGWSANPTINDLDEFGCVLEGQSDSLAASGHAYWHGTVEVEVT